MLSFIPCVTKPCGYSLLLSLSRIHSFMDCHQEFKVYLKSCLNLALQQVHFVLLWAQEQEGVCYIEY